MTANLLAYHNAGGLQAFIREAINSGILRADPVTGMVFNLRCDPTRPLGTLTKRGYLVTTVHVNGTRKQVKLHQVVWLSVGREIPRGMIIDHENRIKTDNRLDNLRLATPLLNSQNRRSYKGDCNPAAKLTGAQAQEIRARASVVRYQDVADEFGVSLSLVAKISRGVLWR